MYDSIKARALALTLIVLSACVVLLLPDAAFARGGRGGGGGGSRSSAKSRTTTRSGPASSGSTKRTRAKASSRTSTTQRKTAATLPAKRPGTVRRWRRRPNGRRVLVADWDYDCTETETVDGTTYHYCNGSWWEKVYDGGDVYWVQVTRE